MKDYDCKHGIKERDMIWCTKYRVHIDGSLVTCKDCKEKEE